MSKKRIYWALIVVALITIAWWGWGRYQNEQIFSRFQVGGKKALTAEEFQKLADILPGKYKADTYGSTTPEGTLALFIDALKKGDADLASKYFIPEKQVEYKVGVQNWTKLNKNIRIADTLSRATETRINKDGTATMGIFEGEKSFMTIFFIKNSYSGKWLLQNM